MFTWLKKQNAIDVNKSVNWLPLLSLLIVGALYFFLYMNFELLPIYDLMTNNADVLLIEEAARSSNHGGYLFEWRLTQAPYFFPDIFIAKILAYAGAGIGNISVYYQAIFGIFSLFLFAGICRLGNIRLLPAVTFAALIYSISYWGLLSQSVISAYFGLIGHHGGVMIFVLLTIIALQLWFEKKSYQALSLSLLFFAVFFGIISDNLVLLATFPFITVYFLLTYWKKEAPLSKLVIPFIFMLVAAWAAKSFGYTKPFPQHREFLNWVLSQFPHLTYRSLKQFPVDFYYYFFHSYSTTLIAILFFAAYGIALHHLITVYRSKSSAKNILSLLSIFIVITPPLILAIQIAIGLYETMDSSRQWAQVIFLSIIFGFSILLTKAKPNASYPLVILLLLSLLSIVHVTHELKHNKGKIVDTKPFKEFIACMEKNVPQGWFYVADYWITRPVRLYSEGRFGVVAYSKEFTPYANASNIKTTRHSTPRYVITGNDLTYAQTVKTLGKPKAIYCEMAAGNFGKLQILDYTNTKAMGVLQARANETY